MGFVFYDTETTGTDPAFDQILQFAAIHTDFTFQELDRFEIRCRLLPHVVPSPGAMRVTRLPAARLTDATLPSHYAMACAIRQKLLAWSPALFLGYNSIGFDEHLLRQAFYKTLQPPYLTNSNGNTRSDAMRIVQAASLFAPGALTLPAGADGETFFKLDALAPANGFAHDSAHDAMADVEATIFLCRRVAEAAPELWSAFMRFSQKAAVADHILAEPTFCLSDFYFGRPYSWLVTVIGASAELNSEYYVYNLAIDPDELQQLTDQELAERLALLPKPVRRLKSNACPMIMPVEDAPAICVARALGDSEVARRAEHLRDRPEIRERLVRIFRSTLPQPQPSPHMEGQLYDGLFSREDEALSQQFHLVRWEERPALVQALHDPRLRTFGRRLIHAERPDLLSASQCVDYDRALARRLILDDPPPPWLTLPQALIQMDALLTEATAEQTAFLQEHRAHLAQCLDRASRVLHPDAASAPVVPAPEPVVIPVL